MAKCTGIKIGKSIAKILVRSDSFWLASFHIILAGF